MERLPRGANFQRGLMLWQIGLHVAGDPNTPYYGNRDMCISVGSGSADNFRPWLRMSTGSPDHRPRGGPGRPGDVHGQPVGFSHTGVPGYRDSSRNPCRCRVVACYPSWDRFVFMIHPQHRADVAVADQRAAVSTAALDP